MAVSALMRQILAVSLLAGCAPPSVDLISIDVRVELEAVEGACTDFDQSGWCSSGCTDCDNDDAFALHGCADPGYLIDAEDTLILVTSMAPDEIAAVVATSYDGEWSLPGYWGSSPAPVSATRPKILGTDQSPDEVQVSALYRRDLPLYVVNAQGNMEWRHDDDVVQVEPAEAGVMSVRYQDGGALVREFHSPPRSSVRPIKTREPGSCCCSSGYHPNSVFPFAIVMAFGAVMRRRRR